MILGLRFVPCGLLIRVKLRPLKVDMGTGSAMVGVARPRADFALNYTQWSEPAAVLSGPRAAAKEIGHFGRKGSANRLYAGDNLNTLRLLCDDRAVHGKARLAYIDPPYATGFTFESATVGAAYSDHKQGADYLESLRQRIIVLRELLADDGSMYLHLDATMIFPAKLLMDEIFGPKRFLNLITRVKCNPKNQARHHYGDICDYLLFYSKGPSFVWNQPVEEWDDEAGIKEYGSVEEGTGRRFKKVPCHLPGVRFGETGEKWRGKPPPPGKHWVHSPTKLDEMDARGEIYWSSTGNPRRKLYLDEATGKRKSNLWLDFRDTQNQNAKITGYPTEKNLNMMEMIVAASSNPGDLVIDAYSGSGTTLAASGAIGRSWIGIDESPAAIETAIKRLVLGTPSMGSHARDSYVKREPKIAATKSEQSFRIFADTTNRDLNKKVGKMLKDDLLTFAFKPVKI